MADRPIQIVSKFTTPSGSGSVPASFDTVQEAIAYVQDRINNRPLIEPVGSRDGAITMLFEVKEVAQ